MMASPPRRCLGAPVPLRPGGSLGRVSDLRSDYSWDEASLQMRTTNYSAGWSAMAPLAAHSLPMSTPALSPSSGAARRRCRARARSSCDARRDAQRQRLHHQRRAAVRVLAEHDVDAQLPNPCIGEKPKLDPEASGARPHLRRLLPPSRCLPRGGGDGASHAFYSRYSGTLATTATNKTCQAWMCRSTHAHIWRASGTEGRQVRLPTRAQLLPRARRRQALVLYDRPRNAMGRL